MFQTFCWMQNTSQRTLQPVSPHNRTRTHKRKALFFFIYTQRSLPRGLLHNQIPRKLERLAHIHTKPVTVYNQTLSQSDAFLPIERARAGLEDEAYVQSTNSNNITHKLCIKKWAQEVANYRSMSYWSEFLQVVTMTVQCSHTCTSNLLNLNTTLRKVGKETGTAQVVLYRKANRGLF